MDRSHNDFRHIMVKSTGFSDSRERWNFTQTAFELRKRIKEIKQSHLYVPSYSYLSSGFMKKHHKWHKFCLFFFFSLLTFFFYFLSPKYPLFSEVIRSFWSGLCNPITETNGKELRSMYNVNKRNIFFLWEEKKKKKDVELPKTTYNNNAPSHKIKIKM